MTLNQVANRRQKRREWHAIIAIGILLTAVVIAALVLFWDEIQQTQSYGYLGCFIVSVLAGMTIIPAPSLPVVLTLGAKLNPIYVGLVSGLGEALGGITVYLTGVGGETIWSKLRSKKKAIYNSQGAGNDTPPFVPPRVETRRRAFFVRVVNPLRSWGGMWPVFITSAIIFSPFYVIALGAGALRLGLRKFFLACWAGKTVKGLIVAFAGYLGLQILLKWLGA